MCFTNYARNKGKFLKKKITQSYIIWRNVSMATGGVNCALGWTCLPMGSVEDCPRTAPRSGGQWHWWLLLVGREVISGGGVCIVWGVGRIGRPLVLKAPADKRS